MISLVVHPPVRRLMGVQTLKCAIEAINELLTIAVVARQSPGGWSCITEHLVNPVYLAGLISRYRFVLGSSCHLPWLEGGDRLASVHNCLLSSITPTDAKLLFFP